MNPISVIPAKYTTPLLTIALIVGAAFQTAIVGGITSVEAFQLGGLIVGAIVTYIAPLLKTGWAAGLKVGGAVLGAVLAAIIPVIDTVNGGPGFNAETITMIAFAGLNALAAQFGVDQRIDAVKEALTSPQTPNAPVEAVEPVAVESAAVSAVDSHNGRTGG